MNIHLYDDQRVNHRQLHKCTYTQSCFHQHTSMYEASTRKNQHTYEAPNVHIHNSIKLLLTWTDSLFSLTKENCGRKEQSPASESMTIHSAENRSNQQSANHRAMTTQSVSNEGKQAKLAAHACQ